MMHSLSLTFGHALLLTGSDMKAEAKVSRIKVKEKDKVRIQV
jgi:hypothetical protein